MRERNQANRVVVEWKKCDIYVFQKNKNCVGLVETIKTMEISKKVKKVIFGGSIDFSRDFPALSSKHQKINKVTLGLGNAAETKNLHDISSALCCISKL